MAEEVNRCSKGAYPKLGQNKSKGQKRFSARYSLVQNDININKDLIPREGDDSDWQSDSEDEIFSLMNNVTTQPELPRKSLMSHLKSYSTKKSSDIELTSRSSHIAAGSTANTWHCEVSQDASQYLKEKYQTTSFQNKTDGASVFHILPWMKRISSSSSSDDSKDDNIYLHPLKEGKKKMPSIFKLFWKK